MKMYTYKVRMLGVIAFLTLIGCATIKQQTAAKSDTAQISGLTLDDALDDLTTQIVNSMTEAEKKKVAVTEFSDLEGKVTGFGKYLAEALVTRLFITGEFIVIERQLLEKVLKEQKLGLTGFFEPGSIKKIGKILGVDAIVSGTITDLGISLKVNARIISTETGRIIAVAATEIVKDVTVRKLMESVVRFPSQDEVEIQETERKSVRHKGNLIVNGNFKKHWSNGWTRTLGDITKGSSKVSVVNVSTGSGKAVKIVHKGKSYTVLYQQIPVRDAKLKFSASFQMVTREGPIIGFSGTGIAMISLHYYNDRGKMLGKTTLCQFVKNPFAGTGLVGVPEGPKDTYREHNIKVGEGWHTNYTMDVEREIIDNLPGVNPDEIKRITIVLWAGATGPKASADLYATDLNLEYNGKTEEEIRRKKEE